MPCLADSDLHLFLLLSLASNQQHCHSAVHPLRPAGWKTGPHLPEPAPDCFINTPIVNRDVSQVFFFFFVFVSIVLFIPFLSCLRPLSNLYLSAGDKRPFRGFLCAKKGKKDLMSCLKTKIKSSLSTHSEFSCEFYSKGSLYQW